MADDAIRFDRTPYKVSYQDMSGKIQTITRIPPPKLHDILPTDVVQLTQKRSDDFNEGDQAVVQAVPQRQPNILQLVNKKGDTTFAEYSELRLIDEVHPGTEANPRLEHAAETSRSSNRYLLWP